MNSPILLVLFLVAVFAVIFGLAVRSDRRRREEMEWYHETMERIADKDKKEER